LYFFNKLSFEHDAKSIHFSGNLMITIFYESNLGCHPWCTVGRI